MKKRRTDIHSSEHTVNVGGTVSKRYSVESSDVEKLTAKMR